MNRSPNIVFLFAGDIVRHALAPTLILAVAASVFAAGPPEPTPPPSAYKIGALHWPLYTQGTHFGWEVIDRDTWSNRRPLLDMYDEDSPEVWAWFNYWAQNYGITYWIMGVRMRESYPANEPYTSGLDAWMKSKYAERMEFCVCFHGGSASERRLWLVNNALGDKRYLKHEGKVVVLCFDGDTNGLRAELDKAGFPSLVFGGGSSEGNFSYLGGWGRGSGMASVSHGFDDRPWGRSSVHGMKSPAEYLAACKKAKDWMNSLPAGAFGKTHASLNCWNEIGEGHFIQPSTFGGVVYDGGIKTNSKAKMLDLYLDGELVSSKHGAPGAAANEDPAGVGARVGQDAFGGADTGAFFKGHIDEVMVSFKYLPQFEANLIQGYADIDGLGKFAGDFSGKSVGCAPQWWLQKKGEWRIAADGDNKVFAHAKTVVTDARTEYQGFFNDATFTARVKVNDIDAARGRVGMIARSLEDDWIEAGYDHVTDTWEIRQMYRGDSRSLASSRGALRMGADSQWELTAEGGSVALFELIKSLGLNVSLWVHEFADYNEQWGRPSPDNAVLWRELSKRYDHILTELMPEVNTLVLTVVETQVKATDPELLRPLATTIKAACDRHGRGFILRSFVHHPEELDEVSDAISSLPDDITIMTKSVPQDWLKLSCRRYGLAPQRDESLLAEARDHLARLENLIAEARQQSLVCEWNGEVHRLQRGRYVDIAGMLKSFADYWGQNAVPCR